MQKPPIAIIFHFIYSCLSIFLIFPLCLVTFFVFFVSFFVSFLIVLCLCLRLNRLRAVPIFSLEFVEPRKDIANETARRRSLCLSAARRAQEKK